MKISSWPNGTDAERERKDAAPNAMPPPRMRQSSGRRSLVSDPISSTPITEIAGTSSPSRNTVSRASMPASQPDSPATARMPNDSDQAADHLDHAELGAHRPPRDEVCRRRRARETTSVDIASATTSWITVPITISIAPRI